MDKEHGGVYTCLTRDGKVFSTDKSACGCRGAVRGRSRTCAACTAKAGMAGRRKVLPDFLEEHCINRTAGTGQYHFR